MLDFLLLILFSFITLCPHNAAKAKYPYWGGNFFLGVKGVRVVKGVKIKCFVD